MESSHVVTLFFEYNNTIVYVMLKQFLAIIVLLGLALLFLCVRILLKKGGKFHSLHIGQSKAMRDRGIHCAQSTDKMEYYNRKNPEDMEK